MVTGDCVRWGGYHRPSDGRAILSGKYVYRLKYAEKYGECPPGVAHHECENKWCVNPDHLSFIPQAEHLREHGLPGDWGQADKTRCPAGHEYTPENTYVHVRTGRKGGTERHCKTCRKATKARYRERQNSR